MTKLIFSLLLIASSFAFASIEQPTLFEVKAKLEEAITKKYHDRISTQLAPDLFSVGAQVTLTTKKEMVDAGVNSATSSEMKNMQFDFSDLPADISLGIMAPAQNSRTPSSAATLNQVLKERIKVTQVLVHVGLSPKLGKAYRDKFGTWLNNNIQSEFAGKGKTSVTEIVEIESAKTADEKMPKTFELKMEPKSIEINVQEPTKPRPLGWEERFGQFQNFIGLSILAIFLMITYFVGKFIPSKDVKAQVAVAEKMQEIQSAQLAESSSGGSSNSRNFDTENTAAQISVAPQLTISYESFLEQQRKVAFLALSSKENMAQVTQIWLDSGEFGRSKIALVLDCVLANLGNIELAKAGNKDFSIDWTMPDSIKNDKGLSKAFQAVGSMDMETKYTMLDKAYWDLLSIRTLGANLTKQRFSGFAQLPPSSIHKILNSQDRKVKSITCLHLPPDKLKQVIATMSTEDKKVIVEQAFNYPDMSFEDLDFVDNHLNVLVQMEQLQNVDSVELPRLVPGLLAVISPLEEIQLINQVLATNQESAFFLKQNYPSIAFLNEWPADKLKMLLAKARNLELLALIQTMPETKDLVLSVLPGRARSMLSDDLQSRTLSADDINSNLTDLRARLNYLYENNEIDLLQIFNSPQESTKSEAA